MSYFRNNSIFLPFKLRGKSLFLFFLALKISCIGGESDDPESSSAENNVVKSVVSQKSTGTFSPFASKDQGGEIKIFEPGEELILNTWKSRATVPRTTLSKQHFVYLTMSQGASSVQTVDLQVVSPLVEFKIRDLDQFEIERKSLSQYIKIETIVDRFIDAKSTVILLYLNYQTSKETRWTISPEELVVDDQSDGSKIVSFFMKDVDFAFSVAVARGGKPTNGFLPFKSVPKESKNLAISTTESSDECSSAKLSWDAVDGSRTGYYLQYGYEPISTQACQGGGLVKADKITKIRQNFPKIAKDSMVLESLVEGATLYLQLCSVNGRDPPDISSGIDLVFDIPKRAKATLSNAPNLISNAIQLDVSVGGDGVIEYQYALGKQGEACDELTYSDWTPVENKIEDQLTAEDQYLLCVKGKKSESNLQKNATQWSFSIDRTKPEEFSIDLVETPSYQRSPTISVNGGSSVETITSYKFDIASDQACTQIEWTSTTPLPTVKVPTLSIGVHYVCVYGKDQAENETPGTNNGLEFIIQNFP